MGLSPQGGIVFEWVCVSLALIFVLLRLLVRCVRQCVFSVSDAFVIASWLCLLYGVIADTIVYNIGISTIPGAHFTPTGVDLGPGTDQKLLDNVDDIFKLFYAAGALFYFSLWCTKAAFIFLYYGVARAPGFEDMLRSMKVALDVTGWFTGASGLAVIFLNLFWCRPISSAWATDPSIACRPFPSMTPYFVSLALHILTDIMIFSIPLPLIRHLGAFTRARQICVCVMFLMGVICISCTVGRAVAVQVTDFSVVSVGSWTAAEQATGIIIVCCPSLRIFYRQKRIQRRAPVESNGRRQSDVYEIFDLEGTAAVGAAGVAGNRNSQTIVMVNENVVSGPAGVQRLDRLDTPAGIEEEIHEWGTYSPRRRSRNIVVPTAPPPIPPTPQQRSDISDVAPLGSVRRSLSFSVATSAKRKGSGDVTISAKSDNSEIRGVLGDTAGSSRDGQSPQTPRAPQRVPLYVRPMRSDPNMMITSEEADIIDRVVDFQSRVRHMK